MAQRGRKAKITVERFTDAVKKKRTLADKDLCAFMGVDRSSVYRFKLANPDVVKEMEEFIKQYENIVFNGNVSFDVFTNISCIRDWVEMQKQRQVGESMIHKRNRALWILCNYLNIHPSKLNIELAAKVVNEMKQRKGME